MSELLLFIFNLFLTCFSLSTISHCWLASSLAVFFSFSGVCTWRAWSTFMSLASNALITAEESRARSGGARWRNQDRKIGKHNKQQGGRAEELGAYDRSWRSDHRECAGASRDSKDGSRMVIRDREHEGRNNNHVEKKKNGRVRGKTNT